MFMLPMTVDGDLRQLVETIRDFRSSFAAIASRLLRSLAPNGRSASGRTEVAEPAWSEDDLDELLSLDGGNGKVVPQPPTEPFSRRSNRADGA